MNLEAAPSEEQKEGGISRRKFIAGAGAALGAATLGYLGREKLGFGTYPKVREAFEAEREAQRAEYEKTGELPELAVQRKLELLHELAQYMERGGERVAEADFGTRFGEFSDAVRHNIITEMSLPIGSPDSEPLRRLTSMKLAFHEQAGTTYNREHHTVADPVLEKRTQCRSGTHALLMIAMEEAQGRAPERETLVMIHTIGHVQPGLLLRDGTLVALEMTSAGKGIRSMGKMTDITKPIRVVRADHGMYQEALGTEAHRDKAVLFETVRDVAPPGEWQRTGMFGFGKADVPEGDRPMPHADMLPAGDLFDGDGVYSRMETDPSDEELLEVITDGADKAYARNYLIQHRTVNEYYKRYAPIVNRIENLSAEGRARPVSQAEFESGAAEILRIASELESFVRANNLDEQYFKTEAIIRKYSSTIKMATVPPSDVVRVMRSNVELLRRRR